MNRLLFGLALLLLQADVFAAETFRVACFNVENYLDVRTRSRHVKSPEAKAKVRESIVALKPDVIALEEMGTTNALMELQGSLKRCGLDLPFWEHITGFDTNIHIAVLSRFPFAARRPHTNDSFLLSGRRFQVSRGFAELDVQVNTNYTFTLLAAHLKSQRPMAEADQSELRLQEAQLLREKIDARLAADPNVNLVVLGDFNDQKDSLPIKTVVGKGKAGLFDTRPAERNGDTNESQRSDSRKITWTHFYSRDDGFTRLDYILLSKGMKSEWVPEETYVLNLPDWGVASDHRPIVAGFVAEER